MFSNIKVKNKRKCKFRLSGEKGLPSTTFTQQSLICFPTLNQKQCEHKFRLSGESGAGFTLIELLVVISIVAILSALVLFSIVQYINRSKDAAISGTLSSLIPTGEVYYDHNGIYGYSDSNGGDGFCGSSALINANGSISFPTVKCKDTEEKSIICCKASNNAWAACSQEFVNNSRAFCVDSRGIKKEICNTSCPGYININLSCPSDDLSSCE